MEPNEREELKQKLAVWVWGKRPPGEIYEWAEFVLSAPPIAELLNRAELTAAAPDDRAAAEKLLSDLWNFDESREHFDPKDYGRKVKMVCDALAAARAAERAKRGELEAAASVVVKEAEEYEGWDVFKCDSMFKALRRLAKIVKGTAPAPDGRVEKLEAGIQKINEAASLLSAERKYWERRLAELDIKIQEALSALAALLEEK